MVKKDYSISMTQGNEDPWSLDLSTTVAILFGVFGIGVSILNLYIAWEQLNHVRV